MPQLVILIAIGAGAYFGYRWLKKQVREAAITAAKEAELTKNARPKKPASPSERARNAGELVWDEKAGVYRSKDDRS